METNEQKSFNINSFLQSPYLYVAIVLLLVLIIIYFASRSRKNRLQQQIEDSQIKLNSLRSVPLPFKVSRALALARVNRDIDETVKTCSSDFDTVQTNFKKLQEMINDSDEFMQLRKYSAARTNNEEIETLLDSTEATVSELDGILNTILDKENVQRQKILDLKESFRSVKLKINENPDKYFYCWEALDQKINVIEHKFSEFETIMAASAFDKAADKIEEIRDSVDELNDVVESIPDLINVSKGEIPIMIEDVNNSYNNVLKQGAYLDHLDVKNNLDLINESLQEDLRKIKQCDVAGVNEHLLECEKSLNQLKQQIEKEKNSYDELMNLKEETTRNLSKLNATVDRLNGNYDEMTTRYGLSDYSGTLADATNKVKNLNDQGHIVMNSIHENNIPASNQLLSLSKLNTEVVVAMNNVNKMADTVNTASNDEADAREQLGKLSIVLNEVQAKIRNSRIPNISDQYSDDLAKAEDYLTRLEGQLAVTPINVTLVNTLKTSAVDLIYQLYESVNRILGTAIMAENAIVIGNMYRSTDPDIDSELTRSELAYRNGEYTQSLTIALNTLRRVHPETVNKLVDSNKKVVNA